MCKNPEQIDIDSRVSIQVKVVFAGLSKDSSLHMYNSHCCNFFLESLHFGARV